MRILAIETSCDPALKEAFRNGLIALAKEPRFFSDGAGEIIK